MTMKELGDLLNHIRLDHSFCHQREGRHVKYIDPHIDTRTWECFAITFRTSGDPVVFHTQNECRDLPESLYERCMKWLDEPTSNRRNSPSGRRPSGGMMGWASP